MSINAFSKDYVKTYMPEFLSNLRAESTAKLNGEKYGARSRAVRENASVTVNTISVFPKTKARVSLKPTEFLVYSRAGMPKGVK
jgi:hypothetical protein